MNSTVLRDGIYKTFKKKGMPLTFSRNISGVYDPVAGSTINRIESYSTYGFIKEYKTYDIDGTLIKLGDKMLLLAISPSMPQPTTDDAVELLGKFWQVILCNPIAPLGVALIFKVQVRK